MPWSDERPLQKLISRLDLKYPHFAFPPPNRMDPLAAVPVDGAVVPNLAGPDMAPNDGIFGLVVVARAGTGAKSETGVG